MNTDERMRNLYANGLRGIHVSENFSRKVINMTEKSKKRPYLTMKAVCAVVAAAVLVVVGAVIGSASRGYKGEYRTVILNGIETKARYGQLNDHCWVLETSGNGFSYNIWIYGEFNADNEKLYIEDKGDYVVASTEANPQLNLYDKIGDSPYGELIEENGKIYVRTPVIIDGEEYLPTDHDLTGDEYDGEKDGKVDVSYMFDDEESSIQTYVVTPNGSIVMSYKGPDTESDDAMEILWGIIWGEEDHNAAVEYAKEQ